MINKRIDNKHSMLVVRDNVTDSLGTPYLAKRLENGTFQAIPEEEPVILFRARDKLALPMLEYYRQLCKLDGCTDFQLASMDDMIRRFREFADTSDTMKQPGITRGM